VAFTLKRFVEVRPYLYHLTAQSNLGRLLSHRRLESAEQLLNRGGQLNRLDQHRRGHHTIDIDGVAVSLRDQAPLYEGNIDFEAGWTFPQVIALLNQRVFFWPGTAAGPIDYGLRHYARYEAERPSVIRVRTLSLLSSNALNPPLFCRYNSGSPRCSGGVRSPRGSATFQAARFTGYLPSEVVEVTFIGTVCLPEDTELRGESWEEWGPMFIPAGQAPEPRAAAGGGAS
jgi:hypothetical protein